MISFYHQDNRHISVKQKRFFQLFITILHDLKFFNYNFVWFKIFYDLMFMMSQFFYLIPPIFNMFSETDCDYRCIEILMNHSVKNLASFPSLRVCCTNWYQWVCYNLLEMKGTEQKKKLIIFYRHWLLLTSLVIFL